MTNILILLSFKVLKELIQKDVTDLNVQEKCKFHSGTIMYLVRGCNLLFIIPFYQMLLIQRCIQSAKLDLWRGKREIGRGVIIAGGGGIGDVRVLKESQVKISNGSVRNASNVYWDVFCKNVIMADIL